MAFVPGDHERLSVHLAVCRTRLQLALQISKRGYGHHGPSSEVDTFAFKQTAFLGAMLNQLLVETLGTIEHVEQHILTPSIGE